MKPVNLTTDEGERFQVVGILADGKEELVGLVSDLGQPFKNLLFLILLVGYKSVRITDRHRPDISLTHSVN